MTGIELLWTPEGENLRLRRILVGLARGDRREKIAKDLRTSQDWVEYQLKKARERTGTRTTVALVDFCYRVGLFQKLPVPEDMDELTEDEEFAVLLRAQGYGVERSAQYWGVSESLVVCHSRNAMAKLCASSMAQAVVHHHMQREGRDSSGIFRCGRCTEKSLDVRGCRDPDSVAKAVRRSGGMRVFDPGSGYVYFCGVCTPDVRKERGLGPRMPLPEELEDPRLVETAVRLRHADGLSMPRVAARMSEIFSFRVSCYQVSKLLAKTCGGNDAGSAGGRARGRGGSRAGDLRDGKR